MRHLQDTNNTTKELATFLSVRNVAAFLVLSCFCTFGSVECARGQITDVVGAFNEIPGEAASLTFKRGEFKLPRGGHLQGIQMRRDPASGRRTFFLSHDSTTVAYLAIVEFAAEASAQGRLIHMHTFPGDGQSPPLRHAGGIQLAGDVLAVGVEDNQQKTRSEIQLWNVADPAHLVQLEHLTIKRRGAPKDKTAGAVGIVKRGNDYLVAVGNWDSRAVDFYASNGRPLDDPRCRFEHQKRWRNATADKAEWQPDKVFASYQALNLLADADGKLFLIAPDTTAGQSAVDLFALDIKTEPDRLLHKIGRKPLRLSSATSFRNAGGASLDGSRIVIMATARNVSPRTVIEIAN